MQKVPLAALPLDGAQRLAYSVDETARLLGLSRASLYNLMKAGRLAYVQVGDRRLIRHVAIEALLASLEHAAGAA